MSRPQSPKPNSGHVRAIRETSTGRLLGRYDTRSGTLEIKRGPHVTRVNLREMERKS
jgi:hypothetical protein